MSQQAVSGPPSGERPGGYRRSSGGLVGAMIVTVLLVLVFVGLRSLGGGGTAVTPESVDWRISLASARKDDQIQALAPASLPSGWRATSASYTPGAEAAWRLGLLTEKTKYVGVAVTRDTLEELVRAEVDENASEDEPVTVRGQEWQVFTDRGGDYALGRTVTRAGKPAQAQLVVGTAPRAQIRDFVSTLR